MDKDYAKYLLEKTRQDYNLIAEDFSRTRSQVWQELKFLEKYAQENEKILDLGCGNGRLYELFREKTIDYYGVDFSDKLIEIAKNRYPQFKFQVADAFNLPFPSDFFDNVFSVAVLHHIPSEELRIQFLKGIRKVLKPEGRLILTVWDLGIFKRSMLFFKYGFSKILGKSKLDFGDVFIPWGKEILRYLHIFSKNELRRLAKTAGFSVKEIKILKRPKSRGSNILLIAENPSSLMDKAQPSGG